MNKFRKPHGNGGRRSKHAFGGRPGFGGGPGHSRPGGNNFDRGRGYPATCAQCGKTCEVPFRPNGSRPVYCSDCFAAGKTRGVPDNLPRRDNATSSFEPRPGNEGVADIRRRMDAIDAKLDRVLEALNASSRNAATQSAGEPKSPEGAAPRGFAREVVAKKKSTILKKAASRKR